MVRQSTKIFIIPHPKTGFEVKWTCPRGEKIVKDGLSFCQNTEVVKKSKDADYYFLIYRPHYKNEISNKAIEKYYGKKLVVIDWIDEPDYTLVPTDQCLAYFKRSMAVPIDEWGVRKYLPNHPDNVFGFAYSTMPEFIQPPIQSWEEKDCPLACFLRDTCQSRANILHYMNELCFKLQIPGHIGPVSDASRSEGINPLFNNTYFSCIARTKFNITCNPTLWEGDSRYWESLSNGCLTFVDRTITPYPNRLIDGTHHIEYSVDNPQELIDKIIYYMNHMDLAKKIANNGRKYALEYHSPVARMRYVLDTINKLKD